jgi:hypothetical protein
MKPKGLIIEGGAFYSRTVQQEIEIIGADINIWERKFSNANLNELGAYLGIAYRYPIDRHFELGIQSRIFYEISSQILAQVTLTPTLTYRFGKSNR